MIPLRDEIRPEKYPGVNLLLILLTSLVFIWQITRSTQEQFYITNILGLVPSELFHGPTYFFTPLTIWLTPFTSLFLHGGWFHILGNLLFLWVFGDNIEDRLGHGRYLLFYLGSGLLAGLAQSLSDPTSSVPIIGASGAIAGVLGAYLLAFPRAQIKTLIFLIIIIRIVYIPAAVFILIWFAMQVLNGLLVSGTEQETVAWWAHIGGFLGGMLLYLILKPRSAHYPNDQTSLE